MAQEENRLYIYDYVCAHFDGDTEINFHGHLSGNAERPTNFTHDDRILYGLLGQLISRDCLVLTDEDLRKRSIALLQTANIPVILQAIHNGVLNCNGVLTFNYPHANALQIQYILGSSRVREVIELLKDQRKVA